MDIKKVLLIIFFSLFTYIQAYANTCKMYEYPNAINYSFSFFEGTNYSFTKNTENGMESQIINGLEGKEYLTIKGTKSPIKNTRAYYGVKENKTEVLVINNKEIFEYDYGKYKFDFENNTLIERQSNGKYIFIGNGFRSAQYEKIFYIKYSKNKELFAFVGLKDNGKQVAVINGKEEKEFEEIYGINISDDGKNYFYSALNDGKVTVVENGIDLNKEYAAVYTNFYLPNTNKLFYYASDFDGKYFAVYDGVAQKKYQKIEYATFSAKGNSYAYEVIIDNKHKVVVKDGVEQTIYTDVFRLSYSEDGEHFSYYARKNGFSSNLIVVDGVEGNIYKSIDNFQFNPTGNGYAHRATYDYKTYKVVINGVEQKYDFANYGPFKYADNGDFYYIGKNENGLQVLIKNGEIISNPYIEIGYSKISDDSSSYVLIGKKSIGVYVIEQDGKQIGNEYLNIYSLYRDYDGKNIFYLASNEKGIIIPVINGIELGEYDFDSYGDNQYTYMSEDKKGFAFTIVKNSTIGIGVIICDEEVDGDIELIKVSNDEKYFKNDFDKNIYNSISFNLAFMSEKEIEKLYDNYDDINTSPNMSFGEKSAINKFKEKILNYASWYNLIR